MNLKVYFAKDISTHYLTQRQTVLSPRVTVFLEFQLTTSCRGRPYADKVYDGSYFISTHYLTQRQTPCAPPVQTIPTYFNSLPHAEVDRGQGSGQYDRACISTHYLTQRQTRAEMTVEIQKLFQLTTSRRGRPAVSLLICRRKYFNSLPHAEVDPLPIPLRNCDESFQLTTSRRGRQRI